MSDKVFKIIIIVFTTIMISYIVYDVYHDYERQNRYNKILTRFFQVRENGCVKYRNCFYRPYHNDCGFKFYNNDFYSDTIEYLIDFYSLERPIGTANLINVGDSLIWLNGQDRVKIIKSTGEVLYMGIFIHSNINTVPLGFE